MATADSECMYLFINVCTCTPRHCLPSHSLTYFSLPLLPSFHLTLITFLSSYPPSIPPSFYSSIPPSLCPFLLPPSLCSFRISSAQTCYSPLTVSKMICKPKFVTPCHLPRKPLPHLMTHLSSVPHRHPQALPPPQASPIHLSVSEEDFERVLRLWSEECQEARWLPDLMQLLQTLPPLNIMAHTVGAARQGPAGSGVRRRNTLGRVSTPPVFCRHRVHSNT